MKLTIHLSGQVRGGKNNTIVTRTGHRFPRPEWAKWRDAMVLSVRSQLPVGHVPICRPCAVSVVYVPEDRRRRDVPAVLDSLWHVLERAGVVDDDRWLGAGGLSFTPLDPSREKACAIVEIEEK
ncbi:MAG: hypothetical protein WC455_20410 [Dehalococcoidia bacterium]